MLLAQHYQDTNRVLREGVCTGLCAGLVLLAALSKETGITGIFAPCPTLPRAHTRARAHTLDLWRKCDCGTETRNTRPLKEHKTVSACAHTLMRSHTDSYMHAHARTHSHTNDHAAQVSGH